LADNDLGQVPYELGVTEEQKADCECQSVSCSGNRSTAIRSIEDAWPSLPVHIKEAVLTLIDSASVMQRSEGGLQ
jgi:hypothetical protein